LHYKWLEEEDTIFKPFLIKIKVFGVLDLLQGTDGVGLQRYMHKCSCMLTKGKVTIEGFRMDIIFKKNLNTL
jgi:hypothetical protein